MPDITVIVGGIDTLIGHLNSGNSAGPDCISSQLSQSVRHELAPNLIKLPNLDRQWKEFYQTY